MTTTARENITTSIDNSFGPGAYTRQRRHGHKMGGGMISLEVVRSEDGRFRVYWNAHNGRGWYAGWKKTVDTEPLALAFAEEKWPVLISWLEMLVPKEGGVTAASAFSAQVASMQQPGHGW